MEKTAKRQQITAEEFAHMKEHLKDVVYSVFKAEEKLKEAGVLHKDMTVGEYLGAVAEEILLSTYKITE